MVLRYPNGQPYYKNASPVEKIQEKEIRSLNSAIGGCTLKKQSMKVINIIFPAGWRLSIKAYPYPNRESRLS